MKKKNNTGEKNNTNEDRADEKKENKSSQPFSKKPGGLLGAGIQE